MLDDLHAADEPTLLLLQFVTRELGDGRLLLVAAYRDVDPTLADPLTTALTEPGARARHEDARPRRLGAGGTSPSRRFASGETPNQELVATVDEETEGNPLFVGEIVRLLLTEGELDASAAGGFVLPQSVKDVIGRRLRHLSTDCNRILTLASVLGREFDLRVLVKAGAVDRDTLLGPRRGDHRSRRLRAGRHGPPAFRARSDQNTVYEALTSTRRAQLHRQIGEALEDLRADDREPYLAELAHHFFEAAPGNTDKAVEYARRAGDRALALLAFEEAARLYGMALELTEDRAHAAPSPRARRSAGTGRRHASGEGHVPRGCRSRRDRGLPEELARAALGYGGRFVWEVSRDDSYLASLLENARSLLSTTGTASCASGFSAGSRGTAPRLELRRGAATVAGSAGPRDGPADRRALDARLCTPRLHGKPPFS